MGSESRLTKPVLITLNWEKGEEKTEYLPSTSERRLKSEHSKLRQFSMFFPLSLYWWKENRKSSKSASS